VATGRRPNTADLGCDQAGITLSPDGFIPVDERYETSARGTFAVGDCTPGPEFTHVSWDDHRVLFGVERLARTVAEVADKPVDDIRAAVLAAVSAWQSSIDDDATVIVIRRP